MRRVFLLSILLPVFVACSGDGDDDPVTFRDGGVVRDAGPPRDAGPERDAGPRDGGLVEETCDVGPLAELGYGGGAIAGSLYVHVRAAADDSPVFGATVIVQGAGTEEIKTTNSMGCAPFDIASGPVDVHIMADDFTWFSQIGLPAQNMTVALTPIGAGAPVEQATVQGNVLGIDLVPTTTTATVGRAGVVGPLATSVFNGVGAPAMQPMRPGGTFGNNIVIQGAGRDFLDYSLDVFSGAFRGLSVLAGEVQFQSIGGGVEFNATHWGFIPTLMISPNEVLTGQDITVTHPVDGASFDISYTNPNPGLDAENAFSFIFFPDGGSVFIGGQEAMNQMATFEVPTLDGPLTGATYAGGVQVQDAPQQATRLSLVMNPGSTAPALDLGAVPDAPAVPTATGRTISVGVVDSDFTTIFINGQQGTVWTIVATETTAGTYTVTLPEAPPALTDALSGQRGVIVQQRTYDSFDASSIVATDYGLGLNIRTFGFSNATITF